MPFTLVGYSQNVSNASLAAIAALADQHVRVNGNDIIVPELTHIVAAYAVGANLLRAQLVSPSLRRYINYEVSPVDINALPTAPIPLVDLRGHPIALDADEALDAQTTSGVAALQEVLVWLADQTPQAVTGDIRTVRVTGTTTLVANAWTNGALTFDQTLPAGEYAVVGMRMRSTTLIAARLVFVGARWRPGCIGMAAQGKVDPLEGVGDGPFRNGNFGEWGRFRHNTPPTVDFLATAADTAETGELDLIKTA